MAGGGGQMGKGGCGTFNVHRDFLLLGVHIARLVRVRRTLPAEQGVDERRRRLSACDEAFCAEDPSRWVDMAGEGVDGEDV